MQKPWQIWIDTGGTFTDCLATTPDGRLKRLKVLSNSLLRLKVTQQTGGSSFRVQFPFAIHSDFFKGFAFCLSDKKSKIIHVDVDSS